MRTLCAVDSRGSPTKSYLFSCIAVILMLLAITIAHFWPYSVSSGKLLLEEPFQREPISIYTSQMVYRHIYHHATAA